MGQLRQTAKHSAIYAVGTVISRLTALVMLPIYTRYLTPSDYGVLELLSMAIDLSGILIGMRISQAMFRFYILSDDNMERQSVVSTVFFTVLIASAAGTSILYLTAAPLSATIFGTDHYILEFQLFSLTLVTNAISAVGLSYIRAQRKPVLFILIGIVNLTLQVTFNVLFVVMLHMHVIGVVYGAILSGGLVAAFLSIYLLINCGISYSQNIAKKIITYIAPLIVASLGAFYVAYADKYFLRVFGGLTEVGLYALAARIGSVLMTANQAFNMSWNADRFEIVKKTDAKVIFQQVFNYLSAILILMGAALSIFAYDFFWFMTDPKFYAAGGIVPILMLAYILNIYTMFCNFGIVLEGKTRHIAEASWIKAIFATLGYVALIPYLGIYGAATTLLIANFVELLLINQSAKKLYDMELRWKNIQLMIGWAAFFVVISVLLPYGNIESFLLRIILFAILIVIFYKLPILEQSDRIKIKKVMTRIYKITK